MIKTEQLALFIAIAEAKSITLGSEQLGLSKANCSRNLKLLEQQLQIQLISRSPHFFALTAAGQSFYQGAKSLLKSLHKLEQQTSLSEARAHGALKICAPSALSLLLQQQLVPKFIEDHPNISLEFITGAPKPRLLEDNFDLLININTPKDSAFIARRLMKIKMNYFASPQYLASYGQPQDPNELIKHHCLVSLNQDRVAIPWEFKRQGKMQALKIKAKHQSDNGEIIKSMAVNSLGVALLPEFLCAQELAQQKLQSLFANQQSYLVQLYGIYPSREFMPAKTAVFLQYLQTELPQQL